MVFERMEIVMKKMLVVLLILALSLPVTAFATDIDPIVGQWYFAFDSVASPEFAANFAPYEKVIGIYLFQENGTVMCLELDILDGAGTPTYLAQGKWEKDGDQYHCSIIGFGEGAATIEDDSLLLGIESASGVFIRFRKLIPFNPYKDYVYRY